MNLPANIIDTIKQVYLLNMQLALSDDGQRTLARYVAEQVRFNTGDNRWGVKSSSPSNPQGPSQLAYNDDVKGQLYCWRWLDGMNAGKPNGVLSQPVFMDITGQNFILVDAVNHLPIPQNETNPQSDELKSINDNIDGIKKLLEVIRLELDQIRDETIILSNRRYTMKIFGMTVVMSPEN